MITRMVQVLSGMIKPAAPTRRTTDLITGNAKNWGHNTCIILMEHYEKCLEEFLKDLTGLLTPGWREAFQVAVRWAQKNLPRITQDAIDHTEALISAQVDARDPAPAQVPPQQTVIAAETARDRVQDRPQTRSPGGRSTRTTVGTMTEKEDQQPGDQQDWHRAPPASSVTDLPSLDQRQVRGRIRRTRGTILNEDSIIEDPELTDQDEVKETSTHHSPALSDLEALFDELYEEEEREKEKTKDPTPPGSSVRSVAQVHRQAAEEGDDEEEYVDSPDHFLQRAPQKFRVSRHMNTQRKLTDWSLVVHKKWLIMGDSNLSNFPDFFNKNLQVDSFPGSHFRHAQALMEKTDPPQDLVVEKIVLAFGINSRSNKSKETTIKTMQGALRSAKRQFPYADIWIPLINFSSELPQDEQNNLQILNEHLERNMPFIPLLPEGKFQTGPDDVHWTAETGEAMFQHWMDFLNAGTP